MLKMVFFSIFVAIFSLSACLASEQDDYIAEVRTDFTAEEKAVNFGLIYTAQWAFYLATQMPAIKKEGSFRNYTTNFFSPHFDKDSFDFNIFQHTLAGGAFYLTYRARGYTQQNAFFWSFLSSLAFEFTIENLTERPSYQDIYQTPVYGTILGIGVEKLSRFLHATDSWWGHGLGYLINPFTLLPRQKKESTLTLAPVYREKLVGMNLEYRF